MKTFKCPKCNKELEEIGVVCQATQTFNIDNCMYSSVEEVEHTLGYYCPECGDDLPFEETDEFIKQVEEADRDKDYIPRHAKKESTDENM